MHVRLISSELPSLEKINVESVIKSILIFGPYYFYRTSKVVRETERRLKNVSSSLTSFYQTISRTVLGTLSFHFVASLSEGMSVRAIMALPCSSYCGKTCNFLFFFLFLELYKMLMYDCSSLSH